MDERVDSNVANDNLDAATGTYDELHAGVNAEDETDENTTETDETDEDDADETDEDDADDEADEEDTDVKEV
jgi:hypothetical protein